MKRVRRPDLQRYGTIWKWNDPELQIVFFWEAQRF